VTLARDFISYMIEFVIEYDVPTNEPLYELCEDIEHYVYTMLIHKKCAHCGRVHSDHHHVGAIGMGRNRDKILQIGMLVISLCRDCHILVESRGNSLLDEWHLVPVPMDAKIGKVYGLSNANLGRETK
jgi:hypothetical protein